MDIEDDYLSWTGTVKFLNHELSVCIYPGKKKNVNWLDLYIDRQEAVNDVRSRSTFSRDASNNKGRRKDRIKEIEGIKIRSWLPTDRKIQIGINFEMTSINVIILDTNDTPTYSVELLIANGQWIPETSEKSPRCLELHLKNYERLPVQLESNIVGIIEHFNNKGKDNTNVCLN